jgi:hypothetical protein
VGETDLDLAQPLELECPCSFRSETPQVNKQSEQRWP